MIAHIIVNGMLGGKPLVVNIDQLVVFQDNGTPVGLFAEYGPHSSQIATIVGNEDFNRQLRNFGISTPVDCQRLQVSKPSGAVKLVKGG